MQAKLPVVIPTATPDERWHRTLQEQVLGLCDLLRVTPQQLHLCIFCRTPFPERGDAICTVGLPGNSPMILELPDGRRLTMPELPDDAAGLALAICRSCGCVIGQVPDGFPSGVLLARCSWCGTYILIPAYGDFSDYSLVEFRVVYRPPGNTMPVVKSWLARLCLACRRWIAAGEHPVEAPSEEYATIHYQLLAPPVPIPTVYDPDASPPRESS